MDIFACGMAELAANVFLVRPLVLGKACVPVNPEHRTTVAAGISYIHIRDGRQELSDRHYKTGNRLHNEILITFLVVAEPFPVIVVTQVGEKTRTSPLEIH